MPRPFYEEDEDVDVLDEIVPTKSLIVYNDDVNSFQHVIQTLVSVCKHSHQQAEQCTYIIHYKGKCSVKQGEEEELINMKRLINGVGIDAKVI